MRRDQFAIPGVPNAVVNVAEQADGGIIFELGRARARLISSACGRASIRTTAA
jgi:hypothetical protein